MEEIRLLRVLREVAIRGSFSAAADALSYTQPAVSQQIARLERQVGAKLIEREPRKIRVTPAGRVVVRYAERVLAELAKAEVELARVVGVADPPLRLGAYPSAAGTIVPSAVSAFRTLANGGVHLRVAEPPELLSALRQRELDVVVSDDSGFCGNLDLTGLLVEPLFDDPLYAVLPLDHPRVEADEVRLVDLREDDWVLVGLPGEGEGPSNLALRACRDAGFEPRVVFSSVEYFALGGLIASGMGVGLLPGLALATLRSDIAVRRLHGCPPTRRVVAVTVDPPASGPVAAMIDCLHSVCERWAQLGTTVLTPKADLPAHGPELVPS